MELWMWTIALAMMVGGFTWGFAFGRDGKSGVVVAGAGATAELESEISALKQEFSSYRDEVTEHFHTTADLVHEMTQSYKAVYEHLASGSQELCAGEVMISMDETAQLEGREASNEVKTDAASDTKTS
ncbi:hypothetical protein MNBD_GAMMA16-2289 [hydrothermal vent metagenome]|uniref:DUF1043 family protein n=1 Tax=hydrothermal vent metagenome TaxID=652676 RepID=A0A3B0Z4M7_9ZZZZ